MQHIQHSILHLIYLTVLFASFVLAQDKKEVKVFPCKNQAEIEFIGFEKVVGAVELMNVETETLVSEGHVIFTSKGKPMLFATYNYDRQGRLSEKNFYRTDGVAMPKTTFQYDSENTLIKENHFSAVSNEPYLATIYIYENGLLKEITGMNLEDNDFLSKQVFSYDEKRNYFEYIETKSYTDRKTKIGYIQDSKCRFAEIIFYLPDGKITAKSVSEFDVNDNPSLVTGYSSEGKVLGKRRFEYEFDKQGNWTKQSHYSWEEEKGRFDWKLMRIEYRKIKYYDSK